MTREKIIDPDHRQILALNHTRDIQVWTNDKQRTFFKRTFHPRLVGLCVTSTAYYIVTTRRDLATEGRTNTLVYRHLDFLIIGWIFHRDMHWGIQYFSNLLVGIFLS